MKGSLGWVAFALVAAALSLFLDHSWLKTVAFVSLAGAWALHSPVAAWDLTPRQVYRGFREGSLRTGTLQCGLQLLGVSLLTWVWIVHPLLTYLRR